jgi:hypothetical protein
MDEFVQAQTLVRELIGLGVQTRMPAEEKESLSETPATGPRLSCTGRGKFHSVPLPNLDYARNVLLLLGA